jgi:hypothetical protein
VGNPPFRGRENVSTARRSTRTGTLAEIDFRYNDRIALGGNDPDGAETAIKGMVGRHLTHRGPPNIKNVGKALPVVEIGNNCYYILTEFDSRDSRCGGTESVVAREAVEGPCTP